MEFPSMRVDGKVAVVTGSGTGIGEALAHALGNAGARVVVTDLPQFLDRAQNVAQTINQAYGVEATAHGLDVTDLQSIDKLVADVAEKWGQIDILVNNAGINIPKYAVDVTEEDWDKVVDIDLKGVFFMSKAAGKHMIEKSVKGVIVNIASQMGVVGYYKRSAYGAAKAGVVNLTRVLAVEWANHGIRVNSVGPTFARTALTAPMFADPAYYDEVISHIPLGRLATPEDIAGAVVFLASPAAGMVTGHCLLVDGGWTAL